MGVWDRPSATIPRPHLRRVSSEMRNNYYRAGVVNPARQSRRARVGRALRSRPIARGPMGPHPSIDNHVAAVHPDWMEGVGAFLARCRLADRWLPNDRRSQKDTAGTSNKIY